MEFAVPLLMKNDSDSDYCRCTALDRTLSRRMKIGNVSLESIYI